MAYRAVRGAGVRAGPGRQSQFHALRIAWSAKKNSKREKSEILIHRRWAAVWQASSLGTAGYAWRREARTALIPGRSSNPNRRPCHVACYSHAAPSGFTGALTANLAEGNGEPHHARSH